MTRSILVSAMMLVAGLWNSVAFGGDFDILLSKVPGDANIVMLLNTEMLFASPLAQKEQWREKYEQAFASGLGTISPNVDRLVLANQTNLELSQPGWQMAAAKLKTPLSLPNLARERKGAIDQIGGSAAIAFPNDTYLVQFEPSIVGMMTPANRQAVASWKATADQNTPRLSEFLTAAVAEADKDTILQAIDLQYAIPADVIRNWLAQSKTAGSRKNELDALVKTLASISGIVSQIRITEEIVGRTTIVFSEDATPLVPIAKPLLVEIMQSNGLTIDELAKWNVEASGKRLVFKGTLSKPSLKRLMSLMDQSLADFAVSDEKVEDKKKHTQEQRQLEASLKYYKGVNAKIQELKEEVGDAATWGHMAQWFDYDAKQIDRLPQLDVDPELLDYGMQTSSFLRQASASLRGIGINTGARKAQVIPAGSAQVQVSGGYGGYSASGYYEWRNVGAEKRAISADEKAKGARDTRAVVAMIQEADAKIRRLMTEKYHTEFKQRRAAWTNERDTTRFNPLH